MSISEVVGARVFQTARTFWWVLWWVLWRLDRVRAAARPDEASGDESIETLS